MASRRGPLPASSAEPASGAGADAGPPAPAVTDDPTRDQAATLSLRGVRALAARLLGPPAATATWTPTGPGTATAELGGRRLLVADQTDPYGCFDTLTLFQLLACPACGDQHPTPIPSPAAPGGSAGVPPGPGRSGSIQCPSRGPARGR